MTVVHLPARNTISEVSYFHEIILPLGDLTILRGTSNANYPNPIIVMDGELHDLTEDQTLELATALWNVMDLQTQERFVDGIRSSTFPENVGSYYGD